MSDDQGAQGGKLSNIPKSKGIMAGLSNLLPATSSANADGGSVAIAGDNNGSVINIQATNLSLFGQQQIARHLPSFLSRVITKFSEDWSAYDEDSTRSLPPEISDKLSYNDFPLSHTIIADYLKHIAVLESVYRGVEQHNDDARRLVRRRAGCTYEKVLQTHCTLNGLHHSQAHDYARKNASIIVLDVIQALKAEYNASESQYMVMQETADLAISLIVADAVIECKVLEKPSNVATA